MAGGAKLAALVRVPRTAFKRVSQNQPEQAQQGAHAVKRHFSKFVALVQKRTQGRK